MPKKKIQVILLTFFGYHLVNQFVTYWMFQRVTENNDALTLRNNSQKILLDIMYDRLDERTLRDIETDLRFKQIIMHNK